MDNETILLALPDRGEGDLERVFVEKAIRERPAAVLSNALAFEKAVYVFNGLKPDFGTFEPLNTLCNAKGVNEILKIVPEWEFNREIAQYLAYIAWGEGWVEMPSVLSFAQRNLDQIGEKRNLTDEEESLQTLKHEAVNKYLEGGGEA
jgi:hypothetical protein